jgi:hypothetical protein
MKCKLDFVLTLGVFLVFGHVSNAEESDPAASFSAFAARVSLNKNTEYAVETFWRQWRGHQVTWTGDVSEVRAGSGHCELYLAAPSEPIYNGYNIVADTRDMLGSAGLKKGDRIQIAGLLHRYRARSGQPVIVTLSEARIVLPAQQPEAPKVPVPPPAQSQPAAAPASTPAVSPPLTLNEAVLDCKVFIEALDPSKNTELAAKTNWRALQPYQVTWSATVQQVDGTSGGAEIYLSCKDLLTYRGYNIVLVTRDRVGAAALAKGQTISFVGLPHRYTFRFGRPTVVTLREGLLIPSK